MNLQSNQTLSATVGDPQSLDAGVIADVTKHVRVVLNAIHKVYCGQHSLAAHGKKLEDGAVFPSNNNTTIDEGQGRWDIISANLVHRVGLAIAHVPNGERRIIRNGGKRIVNNVEVKSNDRLATYLSEPYQ